MVSKDSDPVLESAIRYAYSKGAVMVAGVGNNAENAVYYPAAYEEVIAVSGVVGDEIWRKTGRLKGIPFPIPVGSNYGNEVDVCAPACNVTYVLPSHEGGHISSEGCGTLLSAPIVAGLAALILSKAPQLSPQEVRKIIEESADDLGKPGKDPYYGYGRINVERALKMVEGE